MMRLRGFQKSPDGGLCKGGKNVVWPPEAGQDDPELKAKLALLIIRHAAKGETNPSKAPKASFGDLLSRIYLRGTLAEGSKQMGGRPKPTEDPIGHGCCPHKRLKDPII